MTKREKTSAILDLFFDAVDTETKQLHEVDVDLDARVEALAVKDCKAEILVKMAKTFGVSAKDKTLSKIFDHLNEVREEDENYDGCESIEAGDVSLELVLRAHVHSGNSYNNARDKARVAKLSPEVRKLRKEQIANRKRIEKLYKLRNTSRAILRAKIAITLGGGEVTMKELQDIAVNLVSTM